MTPVEVHFDAGAEATLRRLARRRREVVIGIEAAVLSAERMGWEDSLKVERIKVLGPASDHVAELREMRSVYRLVGFWHDVAGARELHITDIAPRGLLTRRRLVVLRRNAAAKRLSSLLERGQRQ